MATVVSIINLKGGVGKSTLTMMLGEVLAFRCAKNVLLIDMDAQANLSYCMVPEDSIQTQERNGRTTYHLLRAALEGRSIDLDRFVTEPPLVVSNIARGGMATPGTRIDMVVSTPSVAQLDEDLLRLWEANQPVPSELRNALAVALMPVADRYHYVLIDCPPGLSVFSSAALVASHYFVSPVIPEPLSLTGVNLVRRRARELNNAGRSNVEFKGMILNIVKHYRKTHQSVSERLYSERSEYEPFDWWLPDNERLRRLGEFDPEFEGAWATGMSSKFPSVHAKYAVSYSLTNPQSGLLSRKNVEGPKYRLEERLFRLAEELQERCAP